MLVRHPSHDQLSTQDRPGCMWFFGVFFILIGAIVLAGVLGGFTDLDEISTPVKVAVFLLALSALAAGGRVLYRSPLTRARFDRLKGEVTIREWGLFRYRSDPHALMEVEGVYLAVSWDHEGSEVYQPRLKLRSGQEARLSSLWLPGKESLELSVEMVREFIGSAERHPSG
jgi:hypothetical protein